MAKAKPLLASTVRAAIMHALLEVDELTSTEIIELLRSKGLPHVQSNVSYHTRLLHAAGLLKCRREGGSSYWRIPATRRSVVMAQLEESHK